MIIPLNPVKWFAPKGGDVKIAPLAPLAPASAASDVIQKVERPAPWPAPPAVQEVSSSAKAVESVMSTAAVTNGAATAATENGFQRFIDAVGSFFTKSAPVLEQIAVAAEPFLALSPIGPEYDLVVNAIVGVQKTATASLSTGATLTGEQRMALVLEAITPGLTAILASKMVTNNVPAAINQFAQNVYNLQTGPTTTVAPTAVKAA